MEWMLTTRELCVESKELRLASLVSDDMIVKSLVSFDGGLRMLVPLRLVVELFLERILPLLVAVLPLA